MRFRASLALVVWLGWGTAAFADTLEPKNGVVLEGYFLGGNASGVTFISTVGFTKTYPLSAVASRSYGPVSAPAAPQPSAPPQITVPAGTILLVTMSNTLNTSTAYAGQRFTGTLAADLAALGTLVARKGTVVFGSVVDTSSAGHATRSLLSAGPPDSAAHGFADGRESPDHRRGKSSEMTSERSRLSARSRNS